MWHSESSTHDACRSSVTADVAIRQGLAFLSAAQRPDGSWPDFLVAPGTEGREWTTGYVGALLSALPEAGVEPWRSSLRRARAFVWQCRRPAGGWAFWRNSPVDADSTAWCLLFLSASGATTPEAVARERQELRRHYHPADGGFGTYRRGNVNRYPDHSGYFSSTPCVTAAAALALHQLGDPGDAEFVARAAEYLLQARHPQGWWPSFWWDRGIFSTALAVRFLRAVGHPREGFAATSAWLQDVQDPGGSWSGERVPEPSPFLTALALDVLLAIDEDQHTPAVRRGLDWLLGAQLDDGSWSAPPVMKVPAPEDPWRPDEPPSGVIVAGHRRSFVTATVLALLARSELAPLPGGGGTLPTRELRDPDFDDEVDAVLRRFKDEFDRFPPLLREPVESSPSWRQRGAGLSHYLPFWIDDVIGSGRFREAARQMALANRFGQLFCLLQDGVIDQDGTPPTVLLPLDALFLRFIRGYQSLFAAEHPFWSHFERYWLEYLTALAWEKRRGPADEPGDECLPLLGQKFSPVKICAAGMTYLAGRLDLLPALEEMIEALQTGYQLLDDLQDCQEDLDRGAWTWPLMLVRRAAEGPVGAADVQRLLWDDGLAVTVLAKAISYLMPARRLAQALELTTLSSYLSGLIEQSQAATPPAAGAPPVVAGDVPPLRVLQRDDDHLLFDLSSGALYAIDHQVAEVTSRLVASSRRSLDRDELTVLAELGAAATQGVSPLAPKEALPYRPTLCFPAMHASAGSLDRIVERALDSLLRGRPAARAVHLVFFQSDQTVAQGSLTAVVSRARQRAAAEGAVLTGRLVINAASGHIERLSGAATDGCLVQLHLDDVSEEADMTRLLDTVQRLRHAGVHHVGVNLRLVGFRGSLGRVTARLQAAGLNPLGLQVLPAGGLAPDSWSPATIGEMKKAFSELVEIFARSAEAGDPMPLVDVARPLLQIYRRDLSKTEAHITAPIVVVAPDGRLLPAFQLATNPTVRLRYAGRVAAPSSPPRCLARQGSDRLDRSQRETAADLTPLLCRTACWGAVQVNGDFGPLAAGICELTAHQYKEAIWLAVRLEGRLHELSAAFGQRELRIFLPPSRRGRLSHAT